MEAKRMALTLKSEFLLLPQPMGPVRRIPFAIQPQAFQHLLIAYKVDDELENNFEIFLVDS